jgi:hypothetical protein
MAKQTVVKGPAEEPVESKDAKKDETEDPLAKIDPELLRDEIRTIRKANGYANEKRKTMENAKSAYSAAKADYEAAQAELNLVIDDLDTPNLFRPKLDEKKNGTNIPAAVANDWKSFRLDAEFGKTQITSIYRMIPTVAKKSLVEAKIETIGALANWTKDYALTDIRGVGPSAAKSIEEALDLFWRDSGYAPPKNEEKKPTDEKKSRAKPTPGPCALCEIEVGENMIALGGPCLDSNGKRFCSPQHRDTFAREAKKAAKEKKDAKK